MITDIPTKDDFYAMADHIVNEAWEKVAGMAYEHRDIGVSNRFFSESEYFTEKNFIDIDDNYWKFERPKLITALTLILQSVEFRIKGLIVDISPYLLITNATRNPPKADDQGNISFSEFHTLDAQDLIKVHDTFSGNKLSNEFTDWFRTMRMLRNRFMHTVDKSTDITPELIFTSVAFAHKHLNKESPHWIWHRYQYRTEHSSTGIDYESRYGEGFSSAVWEMLPTHYEFASAIFSCSKESARKYFGYIKNEPGDANPKESFYCQKCLSVMEKKEYFDSKNIDSALKTVQYNRKSNSYICAFCCDEKNTKPRDWEDENEE
ncbi:hypothetical protein PJ912_14405 [Pectobacterium colocasium]|nr:MULTISPECIES: hypothetical protein [Pectobacterium]PXB03018.1 hypothetical protein DMB41_07220 [Pectobacterium carotovorum subsp. carotovorum]